MFLKFFFVFIFFIESISANEQKIIYEYKKYEKFDLGNLEVKGQLIAPGDISVREREKKVIELNIFQRKSLSDFINEDVKSIE